MTEPVRLHVQAKRYLCTVEPAYLKSLIKPALASLDLQGGLMSAVEVAEFEIEVSDVDGLDDDVS